MKFHMNLFCLIIALATSIVDGRISSSSMSSSSSSSSSSLSQPIGGSAEDVNPNRRVLEPAGVDSETQYCKATPVGKQRGVVDWQDHDQCKMCEVGQKYWPCDGDILCEGYCTPEDVCDKRIQVAIDDLQQDTDAPTFAPPVVAAAAAASDCTVINADRDTTYIDLLRVEKDLENEYLRAALIDIYRPFVLELKFNVDDKEAFVDRIVELEFFTPAQVVCNDECSSAYNTAGTDGAKGVSCSNDEEVTDSPNYCAHLACNVECQTSFESLRETIEPRKAPRFPLAALCKDFLRETALLTSAAVYSDCSTVKAERDLERDSLRTAIQTYFDTLRETIRTDPAQVVCDDECRIAYITAGTDGASGVSCSNDAYPPSCTYSACIDECARI